MSVQYKILEKINKLLAILHQARDMCQHFSIETRAHSAVNWTSHSTFYENLINNLDHIVRRSGYKFDKRIGIKTHMVYPGRPATKAYTKNISDIHNEALLLYQEIIVEDTFMPFLALIERDYNQLKKYPL